MPYPMKHASMVGGGLLVAGALLLCTGLAGSGCKEQIDNFDSHVACNHYCDKKFDCNDDDPTSDELEACVSDCRGSIEDDCGNDNQAEANDTIEGCVDEACTDFWACMVFDTAPECFGFVGE